MATSENWLVMATCGHNSKNRTSFDRTTLLGDLRDRICRLADGKESIAGSEVIDDTKEYDPMSEIDSGSVVSTGNAELAICKANGGIRARYYRNRAKNCIVTVNMPSRCPEIDPNCKQMRPVKLFIENRLTVWLSLDDVPWAIKYFFQQNQLKGVPVVDDGDAGPGAAVFAAVLA